MKAGDTLGPYHILDKLGQGGMGEVYRATDTNLKRQVAIKVLPEAVASDSERLARFQREAEVLGALNHPNIAQIYGLERSDPPSLGAGRTAGTIALIMELVEGPTLAERIEDGSRLLAPGSGLGKGAGLSALDSGRSGGSRLSALGSGTGAAGKRSADPSRSAGLPVDEALAIARQIADALEAAHEQGIVHRDLKPANLKVRPDGTVKVLDFGLAKALAPDPARAAAGGLSQSPTITTPAATMQGVILGTAAYMSPEQAKGLPVDRRADVFAFGAVFYEMLTGCPAFAGDLAAEVLASVINKEPDYSRLPAEMSPRVGNLLRRCLEKAPRNRWQAVGDIRYEIDQILAEGSSPPSASRTGQLKRPSSLVWTAVIAVAMLGTWAATWSWMRARQRDSAPAWATEAVRLTISPPGDTVIDSSRGYSFAVSPDGDRLVFAAIDRDGTRQLWMRSLRADVAQPIAGSAGAWSPFWSADGAWIGFYANRSLRRVRPAGGEPETITALHVGRDFDMGLSAWGSRGEIVADAGNTTGNRIGLIRIVPQTGAVSPVTGTGDNALDDSPSFLSDGNRFLYLGRTGGQHSRYSLLLGSLDGLQPRLLMEPESWARFEYVPGYVLFVRDNTLFARPFDEEEATLTGPEVRVIDGVPMSPGVTPFSASRNGVLAYWQNVVGYDTVFRWVDRRGNMMPAVEQPGRYSGFALSPDGTRLVMSRMTREGPRDVWLRDMARRGEEKRTFDGDSLTPIWASDGGRIAFSSSRGGPPHVFVGAFNSTEDEPVTPVGHLQFPRSLHGNDLVYEEVGDDGWSDLWVAHLTDRKTEPLSIDTPFNESYGRISGDGRRLAYVTDSSGHDEVRLAPFPSLSRSVPVSVGGGSFPEWRADGRELYYVSSDRQLMRVAITGDADDIQVGTPEVLFRFEGVVDTYDRDSQIYAPSPDGQRFLVAMRADVPQPPIRVILNWPALLEE